MKRWRNEEGVRREEEYEENGEKTKQGVMDKQTSSDPFPEFLLLSYSKMVFTQAVYQPPPPPPPQFSCMKFMLKLPEVQTSRKFNLAVYGITEQPKRSHNTVCMPGIFISLYSLVRGSLSTPKKMVENLAFFLIV